MHAPVVLTSHAGTPVPTLGSTHSQAGYLMASGLYPYGFRDSYRECA